MICSHNGKEMSVSCDNVVTRHEQHYFVGFLAQSFYKRLRNGQDIPRRCCSSVAFSYFTFDKSTSADPFFALRCAGQTLPGWHGRFHSGTLSALKWSQSGSNRVIQAKFGQRSKVQRMGQRMWICQRYSKKRQQSYSTVLEYPHPLTHSLHFAALAKLCPDDMVASALGPFQL